MNKSPLKTSQYGLTCYIKRFMKMTQTVAYIRRELPDGTEIFSYSYSDDPGQNETEITRERYKAVRGVKEYLLDLEIIDFSDDDISNLRVDVRRIFQTVLETSVIKIFHVIGKFSGSDIKGIGKFRSLSAKSMRNNLLRIEKKLELKLKGYTSFTGEFSFNKIVVKSRECWAEDSFTATDYILNSKKHQLIQSLPERASVGDTGIFMEVEDSSDKARLSWRLENNHKQIYLVVIKTASKVNWNLSYSETSFYELDLEGNFYHDRTRLEFSNGDNLLLNTNDIFSAPNIF